MPIYEVTLRQTYFGQRLINRFHYIGDNPSEGSQGAFSLINAMGFVGTGDPVVYPAGSLFSLLRAIQATALQYDEVEARNLYQPTDFFVRPFPSPTVGLSGGEPASPVLSTGFRSNRIRTDIGRGFKRFAGISENAMAAGGNIDAGVLASLAPLAAALSADLSYTSGAEIYNFAAAVLSFEPYETPSGRTAYRPYATEAAQLEHAATPVVYTAMPQVRTQNSRQYGRGM